MQWRVEYTYDVFDHLVERGEFLGNSSTPSKTEAFVWDGWNIALVLDGAGGVSQRYFTGEAADEIFASENALGEVLWSLTDHLNTPRDFLDSAGTLQNHRVFDSFGRLVSETNAAATDGFSFFFTGGYRDPLTALDLRWHRWYDSQVGRWLSEDPIGFAGGDGNLGRYAANSPSLNVDPSGLSWAQFWADYWEYATTPSKLDTDLKVTGVVVGVVTATSAAAAGALVVAGAGSVTVGGAASSTAAAATSVAPTVAAEVADTVVEAAVEQTTGYSGPIPISPTDLIQDGAKCLLRKGAKGLAVSFRQACLKL